MKFLVYYVLIGDKFKKWVETSIVSLQLSKYIGDILVISDRPFYQKGVRWIKVKKLSPKVYKQRLPGCNIKSTIFDYVKKGEYDFILYLDIDVLVNIKRDIMGYLKGIAGTRAIYIQEHEKKNMVGSSHIDCFLTRKERSKWRYERPYCSGVVGVPGGGLGYDFMIAWKSELAHPKVQRPGRWEDQPALNAVVMRQFRDRVGFIDACFPRELKRTSRAFLHFKGKFQCRLMLPYFESMKRWK